MYNYTPQATHHAKFDFDRTTWVVRANCQFATVLGVFLSFFLPFFFVFFGSPTSRAGGRIVANLGLINVFCAAFWG